MRRGADVRGTKPRMRPAEDALTRAPPVPGWLSKDAKAEWRRIMPSLASRRTLTAADMASVENYCVSVGRAREIEREIQGADTINGTLFRMQDKAMQTARQLAAELGLTPTSRNRPAMHGNDDDEADDPDLGV